MPAYWEFKAMAASIGLDNLLGNPGEPTWPHETGEWWLPIRIWFLLSLVDVASVGVPYCSALLVRRQELFNDGCAGPLRLWLHGPYGLDINTDGGLWPTGRVVSRNVPDKP